MQLSNFDKYKHQDYRAKKLPAYVLKNKNVDLCRDMMVLQLCVLSSIRTILIRGSRTSQRKFRAVRHTIQNGFE